MRYSTLISQSKKTLFFRLIFVFVFLICYLQSNAQWRWLNPKPSGYYNNKIEFSNYFTGFIFNSNGDLFKTTDRGQSWQFLKNFQGSYCMDLRDSVIVVAGYSTLYFSSDTGKNWVTLNTGIYDNFYAADIISADTFFLSNNQYYGNIYKTTDRGKTFTTLKSPLTVKAMDFVNSKIGFVGGSESQIYKTKDGGSTWEKQHAGYSWEITSIDFVTKDTGFAAQEFDSMLVTYNGGNTWKSNKIPRTASTIHFLNKDDGYLGGSDGDLYATHNGGKTFTWIGFDVLRDGNDITSVYFLSKDTGFAVGQLGRIMKTTDAGKNWIPYSPTYFPITSVSFGTSSVGYATDWNHVYKSVDKGETWDSLSFSVGTEYTSQSRFENAHFKNADTGFLTSSNPTKLHLTYDGGKTWKSIVPGQYSYDYISDVQFLTSNIAYLCSETYSSSAISKTKDGGNSWEDIWRSTNTNLVFTQIYFVDELTGYASNREQLYKTTDGGKTWLLNYSPVDSKKITDIWFVNAKKGFFVDDYSYIGTTNDSGKTWSLSLLPTYISFGSNAIKFYNEQVGYITAGNPIGPGNYGYIYQTIDSGATWQLINNTSGNSIVFTPDSSVIIAGFGGNMLKSSVKQNKLDSLRFENDFCSVTISAVITAIESTSDSIVFEVTEPSGKIILIQATPGSVTNGRVKCKAITTDLQEDGFYSIRARSTYNGQYQYSNSISVGLYGRPKSPVISRVNDTLYSSYETGNQWFRNDTLIAGATEKYFIIPTPLRYKQCFRVKETIYTGCELMSEELCLNDIILPSNFIIAKAVNVGHKILVSWQCQSEINENYFSIEKSLDGINFKPIGKVYSLGSNNTISNYYYEDTSKAPAVRLLYYRIKKINKDESFIYSNVATVNILVSNQKMLVTPNPATNNVMIHFNDYLLNGLLTIYNSHGVRVATQSFKNEFRNSFTINTSSFAAGVYWISLDSEKDKQTASFIIVR